MAHKKANIEPIQKECEAEAIEFIVNWYRWQNVKVNENDIFIVWFAFTKRGYRCMLSTHVNPNMFFELSANKRTKDIQCDCYERYEHITMNGPNYEVVNFTNRINYLV